METWYTFYNWQVPFPSFSCASALKQNISQLPDNPRKSMQDFTYVQLIDFLAPL